MKYIRLITIFLFASCAAWGQYSSRNNEAKLDAEYYMMTQEYDRAIRLLLNILKTEPDNADVKYKLGICYLNTETEKQAAIQYLEEAALKVSEKYNPSSFKEMNAPISTHFLLGSAYRVDNQLDKALRSYQTYKELLNPKDEYNNMLVDQYIRNCAVAAEMMKKPLNLHMTNLGSQINNEVANYSPVLSGNGQSIAYTSPGRNGNDIFFSTMSDGIWDEAANITSQLGGNGKTFKTTSLSHDGGTLYLVLEDPFDSDIYVSTYSRNRWSRAESMDKPVNGKMNETHASISADGRTIYFTSDRSGGVGDLDIYKSTLTDKGKWSKPVNLGPAINTMFNEEGPVISEDGSTLYFSSEGHDGMGGFDIYRIDIDDAGAEAVNLGYPINTTDNNYFFFPIRDGSSGYYALKGDDSYGGQDIYMVDIIPAVIPKFLVRGSILSDAGEDAMSSTRFTVQISDNTSETIQEMIIEPGEPLSFSRELTPGDYLVTVSGDGFAEYADRIIISEEATNDITIEAILAYQRPQEELTDLASEATEELLASEDMLSAMQVPVPEETEIALESPEEPVQVAETSVDIFPDMAVESHAEAVPEEAFVSIAPETEPHAEPEMLSEPETVLDISYVYKPATTYVPINTTGKTSYTLQLMALKKPVDLIHFSDLSGVSVTRAMDEWYRYTWGMAPDMEQAEGLKNDLAGKGYGKAFIVRKPNAANYTIQVMAVPGPVVDLEMFSALPVITVTRSTDVFCRYTTGEYETLEQANADLERIRQLGYPDAFVRRTISLF